MYRKKITRHMYTYILLEVPPASPFNKVRVAKLKLQFAGRKENRGAGKADMLFNFLPSTSFLGTASTHSLATQ